MSKIELPTITSGHNLSAINNNFQKIEDALNKEVLYRKNYVGEPNEMQANLDMNSKEILNVSVGASPGSLVTRGYVDQEIAEERAYVDQELAKKFDKSGGPLSGPVDMQNNQINNLPNATQPSQPATYEQLLQVEAPGDSLLRNELAGSGGAELVSWSHLNELSVSMTVASRLRKKVYASDLGVSPTSTPEHNRNAMQWMIDQSSISGVSAVFDIPCEISGHLLLKSNCTVFTPRYVSIKVASGVDSAVITTGAQVVVENVYVEGGALDGNQQNAPRLEAVSVVSFGACDKIVLKGVEAKNGSGYGFAFQARPQSTITPWLQGIASNIIFDSCVAANNGVGTAAGGDTYDGFDVKYVEGCLFFKCRATGNSDKGFDPRGDRVFMVDCEAISNGSRGFGFSASYSDTGHPVKGSFFLSNLVSDNNGSSGFLFSEGAVGNTVGYSVIGSGLLSKASGTQGFRVEAQNADIVINSLIIRGTASHGVYVASGSVNSLNISQLLVRGCGSNGIAIDTPTSGASSIQFSNIDVIGATYGADIRTPEAVVFTGGRLSGVAAGPIRIDAIAATPVLTGIVDGDITYKKGDVISNINPTLALKLGMDKVVVSSTTTINNISPMIEGREVAIVASGPLTFQNSSAMQVQASPVNITDGNLIKFVAINGKWRQV